MTPEQHATQLSLVRSAETREAHLDVYPVRGPQTDRTGPSEPLFNGAAFQQLRGQTALNTDNRESLMAGQQNEQGRYIITQSEWNAKHADFKLAASESQSGEPMMLRYDERYGTCLVPVVIVPDRPA